MESRLARLLEIGTKDLFYSGVVTNTDQWYCGISILRNATSSSISRASDADYFFQETVQCLDLKL